MENTVVFASGYFMTMLYLAIGAALCVIAIKINDKLNKK